MKALLAAILAVAVGVYVRDPLLPYVILTCACGYVIGRAHTH